MRIKANTVIEYRLMLKFFIGIDIGTQGTRVVLIDSKGETRSAVEESFPLNENSRQEQSPYVWWETCLKSLKKLLNGVSNTIDITEIKGISVTSTSGTVIPLDKENKPLHNAIMYSDQRSFREARKTKEAAEKYYPGGYTGFNTSSGLSKMVWYMQQFPDETKKIGRWVHAADYILGKLSQQWGVTDYTNSLKSGFDVKEQKWPEYLFDHLLLMREWLPEVVAPGKVIGTVAEDVAAELRLSPKTEVAAGMTDGCASQIASGAVNPGDWNTTIGTTLVVKGVTRERVDDPHGRIYNHRHPMGYWMPGGASNTGADWITSDFGNELVELNRKAEQIFPTSYISYPLKQKGERFPFIAPQAKGFEPDGISKEERFTANMEGVAYLERYAFDLISHLSGETIEAVYTAGGGSNSDTWLKIRSNVLKVPVYKMKNITGAVGAAILAASGTHFDSIIEATRALTQTEKAMYPDQAISEVYEKNYRKFLDTLLKKEYITREFNA